MTSGGPIRVFVVDDQALVRAGFRMILEAESDLVVAGEAGDGDEAVARISADPPDVVLMDVRMPGVDGIEATRRLLGDPAHAGVRVIMLTTFDMDEYVYDALRAGSSGFVLKDVPPEQLVDGIRAVHSGSSLLTPSITRRMIETHVLRPTVVQPPDSLTPREREILGLLGRGLSNAEIADSLVVSETTVKTHVGRVLMKLGLRDRVQAVIFAYESGVVTLGSNPAAGR
ncbi:MAG TPA: response regulator transcription factor [Blastococcus sp.]|nr:response regulator transcription factor [Blastococcus sp.]